MKLKARISIGFIAGLIAGIVMDIIDQVFYLTIKEHTLRSVDWLAILVYGRKINNYLELALFQVAHLFFSALLGMIFVYFAPKVNHIRHLLKGWFWAILVWFLSIILTILFNVPTHISVLTITLHFLLATVYGLVLAATTRWLENKPTGGEQNR